MFLQSNRSNAFLAASAALFLQADENGKGAPWWVWLLIIIAIVFLVWLWFGRAPADTKSGSVQTSSAKEPLAATEVPSPPVAERSAPAVTRSAPAEPSQAPPPVKQAAPAAAAAKPDDLKRIEGIGPKISAVLQAAGIKTFGQLAAATPAQLEQMMREGEVRIAYPETWPEQASFAAAGDWEGLAKLQESLKGGRRA